MLVFAFQTQFLTVVTDLQDGWAMFELHGNGRLLVYEKLARTRSASGAANSVKRASACAFIKTKLEKAATRALEMQEEASTGAAGKH